MHTPSAPLKLRFTRRDLARIKTVITEKQRAALSR